MRLSSCRKVGLLFLQVISLGLAPVYLTVFGLCGARL